jgi:hypothetical protein
MIRPFNTNICLHKSKMSDISNSDNSSEDTVSDDEELLIRCGPGSLMEMAHYHLNNDNNDMAFRYYVKCFEKYHIIASMCTCARVLPLREHLNKYIINAKIEYIVNISEFYNSIKPYLQSDIMENFAKKYNIKMSDGDIQLLLDKRNREKYYCNECNSVGKRGNSCKLCWNFLHELLNMKKEDHNVLL